MQNSPNQIQTLLNSYRKSIDKTIQRSALLQRNKLFLSELNGFKNRVGEKFFRVKDISNHELQEDKEDNVLLQLDYPVEDFSDKWKHGVKTKPKMDRYWKEHTNYDHPLHNPPRDFKDRIANKWRILDRYHDRWWDLCERWHIEMEWDGELESLDAYTRQNVEVFRQHEYNITKESLSIKINEWTTLEDIKSRWSEIEGFQNEIWGKRERRPNFTRDLIWFDLTMKHKLTPSQIAILWNEKYPEDIDLLVIRRFRSEIDNEDLGGKVWEDDALLIEVLRGVLSTKYQRLFLEEKEFYITGKIKKGNRTITSAKPFVDVIKKAIKRMSEQISKTDMPPLPKERSFIGGVPYRIA